MWVPLLMQPALNKTASLLDSPNHRWLRLMAQMNQARAAMAMFHGQLQAE